MRRDVLWRVAVSLGAALLAPGARAQAPALTASMDCLSEPGSGRLVCAVHLEPPRARRLVWSDALVISVPSAVEPLRSRVAGSGSPPRRVTLAFVPRSGEAGRIEVLARAVLCPDGRARREPACEAVTRRLGFDVVAP